MKYLAIDAGDRRTGFAVGDDLTCIVSPLRVVETSNDEELLRLVKHAVSEIGAGAIVIGLPLNMDDTEGAAARKARILAERLAKGTGLHVHLQDERLTSYEADQTMSRSGRTHQQKRQIRDALAAATILRDFLGADDDQGATQPPR